MSALKLKIKRQSYKQFLLAMQSDFDLLLEIWKNRAQMDYHYDPIESFTIMSEENDKCSIEHTIAIGLMVVYGYDKWKRDKRCRS